MSQDMQGFSTEQVQPKPVYSWRNDIRRYYIGDTCIGIMRSADQTPSGYRGIEWIVRFTEPSTLPWTDIHTPRILSERTVVAYTVTTADVQARDWLESEYLRHIAGNEMSNVVEDYITFETARKYIGENES